MLGKSGNLKQEGQSVARLHVHIKRGGDPPPTAENEVGKTSYVAVRGKHNLDRCTCCSPVTTLCRFRLYVAWRSYALYWVPSSFICCRYLGICLSIVATIYLLPPQKGCNVVVRVCLHLHCLSVSMHRYSEVMGGFSRHFRIKLPIEFFWGRREGWFESGSEFFVNTC